MRPKSLLTLLLALVIVGNTGVNIFIFTTLSGLYTADVFKPDIVSRQIQEQVAADNIALPPINIIKFISAYAYSKPCQIVFTGQSLVIFVNLSLVSDLTDPKLKAIIAHEVGHYVKGHLNPSPYAIDQNNFNKEIEADSFAAKYAGIDAIRDAIKQFVWDPDERDRRLIALNNN